MPRIGNHELPARTLMLAGVDAISMLAALLAATTLRIPSAFAIDLQDAAYWLKLGIFTLICWLSLYYNDLYDFAVVRRRTDLFAHTLQALGSACLALAVLYFLSPSTSLGRGVALTAAPVI